MKTVNRSTSPAPRKPRQTKAVKQLLATIAKRNAENANWAAESKARFAAEQAGPDLLTELRDVLEWLDSDFRATQVADDETPLGFTQIDADMIRARMTSVQAAITKATPSP